MPITAANGQTYSDDQIKSFFASNPDPASIASQAASLGLNESQIQQASQIAGANGGQGYTTNDINGTAQSLGYNFNGSNGAINPIINGDPAKAYPASTPTSLQVGNNNYSNAQVSQWMSGKSPSQIAQEAAQLGLNSNQISQAYAMSGQNYSPDQISQYAQSNGLNFNGANGALGYNVNPNTAGGNAYGGSNGMTNGTMTTQGGQQVTHGQLAAFAATNPTDQQILQQAAQWGMSQTDINTALNNLGLLFNNGNPTSAQQNDPTNGSIYNRLSNELYQGTNGYGIANNPGGGPNTNGQIVAGNGNTWVPDNNGGGSWQAYGNNTTGYNTPGTMANPSGSLATNAYNISQGLVPAPGTVNAQPLLNNAPGQVTGGIIGNVINGASPSQLSYYGLSTNTTNAAPSNTSLNGSTTMGVTSPMTVAGQVNNLTNQNNPLIQQATAQALGGMNDRGLLNSSLAQTAGQQAAYSAALPIAQADAGTNAAAGTAGTLAQNQFALTQNQSQNAIQLAMASGLLNQQTQMDVTNLSGRFNQLSNVTGGTVNLSNQYSSALQSIISNPNLNATAMNAAVAQLNAQYNNSLTLLGQINDPTATNSPTSMVQSILS